MMKRWPGFYRVIFVSFIRRSFSYLKKKLLISLSSFPETLESFYPSWKHYFLFLLITIKFIKMEQQSASDTS